MIRAQHVLAHVRDVAPLYALSLSGLRSGFQPMQRFLKMSDGEAVFAAAKGLLVIEAAQAIRKGANHDLDSRAIDSKLENRAVLEDDLPTDSWFGFRYGFAESIRVKGDRVTATVLFLCPVAYSIVVHVYLLLFGISTRACARIT